MMVEGLLNRVSWSVDKPIAEEKPAELIEAERRLVQARFRGNRRAVRDLSKYVARLRAEWKRAK